MRLVYPLFYYQRPRSEGRKVRVSFHVDVAAAWNVAGALERAGFMLGNMFFHYPPPEQGAPGLLPIDVSRVGPNDLILTATRLETEPPDSEVRCRKQVQRGHTNLEQVIEAKWRGYIDISERLRVVVRPRLAKRFDQAHANRFHIRFSEGEGAHYKRLMDSALRSIDKNPPYATAGYVLRLRELWPGGPGYLGFFGLDGTAALLFSDVLRRRHTDLLHEEGFAIVELTGPGAVPEREPDMRWASNWRSEVILRAPARYAPNDALAPKPEAPSPL